MCTTSSRTALLIVAALAVCRGQPSQLYKTVAMAPSEHAELSALFERDGRVRHFESLFCMTNQTVASLYRPFAAHAVEWNILGRDRAWWSVLTDLPQTKTISKDDKLRFYKSGGNHVKYVFRELQLRGDGAKHLNVLDFGCGLGRLAFAFAHLSAVRQVACVDQSVNHLRIAKEEWQARKRPGDGDVEFVLSDVDLLRAVRGQRYDVVHSVIVLQHMVAPLQAAYMEQLCDVLAPGGVGWFQVPSSDALGNTPPKSLPLRGPCDIDGSIARGNLQMHYTPTDEIVRLIWRRGCMVHTTDIGNKWVGAKHHNTVVHIRKQRTGLGA